MKASEVRLGNWVNFKYNGVDYGNVKINFNFFRHYEMENYVNKPIPLTEKWLLKFGLKKFNTSSKTHAFELWEGSIYYVEKRGKKWFVDDYGNNTQIEVKSVHQLQNLYFALTGKEIEKP